LALAPAAGWLAAWATAGANAASPAAATATTTADRALIRVIEPRPFCPLIPAGHEDQSRLQRPAGS
jgi:hypothetical protein